MPRQAKELTPIEVKRLAHPGGDNPVSFAVGGVSGLMLQVTPSGAKSWLLRATVGDRRRWIGLGGYPDVTLAMARERARDARDAIRQGVDPVEQRKATRAALVAAQKRGLTFSEAVDKFLAGKLDEFRNEKHRKQWRSTLDMYAGPAIGDMLVHEIDVHDILRTLQPIWTEKTETASRLRGRIENVLAWATVAGHRTGDNPARWKGNLDAILPKPGKVARGDNHPALALADAARWFADLRKRSGMATRALEFAALTAARSGEVRGATWNEIDLQGRLWVVPKERMKAAREHRVPLTDAAVELLCRLPKMAGSDFVFPAARGGVLSDMSLSAAMKRIHEAEVAAGQTGYVDARSGRAAVPHGLRSTFRDWAAERTDYPRDMAEMALAHNIGSEVERAYRRGDMVEKRRAMMAAWGRFLRGEAAPIVISMEGLR
ncbi:tyrosine-type recombinase/integrase [Defluviimonas salinarum]|uniref:Integrase arm-type DNA-binding domain-containing protein n=1 Tax=Defluviimonas salinarum TaxID=2992147 RepID=A0ABT3IYH8_9RHOB|nr:integrase arm-type DNA-binding domain-containing protein [Defluviimonas salinarum]MCW3780265.1 integrase arm-type DNA-binding domain-containing protein [Defluviimonas salinarum]